MKKIIFLFAFALLGTMAFASNVNPVKKETGKVGKVEEKSTLKKSNVDESILVVKVQLSMVLHM